MPKILVVDDEVHILKIIDYKLRTAGYTVIAATDGLEGLEKARVEQPDLILLDVMMPRMDGFQALEALKRDPTTKAIPVFMLTVKGKEMDRLRGLQMGIAAYITKPFSPNALLARIDETLRPG
jgi:DNA-binding response OmpR family regulator